MNKQKKHVSVHRPYPDGCWEFESFFRHVIDGEKFSRKRSIETMIIIGNRLRLRTIWANGETTDTVAYNFKVIQTRFRNELVICRIIWIWSKNTLAKISKIIQRGRSVQLRDIYGLTSWESTSTSEFAVLLPFEGQELGRGLPFFRGIDSLLTINLQNHGMGVT